MADTPEPGVECLHKILKLNSQPAPLCAVALVTPAGVHICASDIDRPGWCCGSVVIRLEHKSNLPFYNLQFLNICSKTLVVSHIICCKDRTDFVQKCCLKLMLIFLCFCFPLLQFPSIMTPVLDSVDAISCTCEKVLSEMTCEPITGEHYNILEVQNINRLCH